MIESIIRRNDPRELPLRSAIKNTGVHASFTDLIVLGTALSLLCHGINNREKILYPAQLVIDAFGLYEPFAGHPLFTQDAGNSIYQK